MEDDHNLDNGVIGIVILLSSKAVHGLEMAVAMPDALLSDA